MEKVDYEARVKEVMSDGAYVKELLSLDTAEEVQASLKKKGVEVSIEEINQLHDMLARPEDGELSDEDLENVNGGCWVAVTLGVLIGGSFASGIGTLVAACCMSRW